MNLPKWAAVARNEYRMRTSSIRGIRPYFPFIVVAAMIVYVVFIAPLIVNIFVDELVTFFVSQAAVPMMQIVLFMFFFMFITFPMSYALKDMQVSQQEIFLSAPVKSSSILLGEFFGELPLYGIIVVLITGFFTAVLNPLNISILQKIIVVIVFLLVLTSALWIGTVITALLRTRLGKTSKGRDIGKSLSILIILPAIAVMYTVMSEGTLKALADPQTTGLVNMVLGWLPSSWGADIFAQFALHPGSIMSTTSVVIPRFLGLIIFLVGSFFLGVKIADHAYSLETTSFAPSTAGTDNMVYRALKQRPFGILVTSIFKAYTRTLQNLSWAAYIVGIMTLLTIFFVKPETPEDTVILFFFFAPILAAVVASDITMRGKETLFIYRKVPHGENRLIKAMILKNWVVTVCIAGALIAVSTRLSPGSAIEDILVNTGLVIAIIAGDVLFAVGVFLIMPAYTERGGEFLLDIMILVWTSIGLFALAFYLFENRVYEYGSLIGFHWIIGCIFLYIGKLRLSRIE
jgi:hypothetical protein